MMPNLASVKEYLGDVASQWSDAELTDALAAETQAQARLCSVPTVYPDDLRSALHRRVARNLSLRTLPLGVSLGTDGSGSYIPRWDGEVRRLEAPYRRMVIG